MVYLTVIVCLIPHPVNKLILKLLGHSIAPGAKIGFSIIASKRIILANEARIHSFNFIKCNEVNLSKASKIKRFNIIKGNFVIDLGKGAIINRNNLITSGYPPITYGNNYLKVGEKAIIGVNHFLDLTNSIELKSYSILAGRNSEIWTHSYYHEIPPDRFRIEGKVTIGENSYIGSKCVITPGITVGKNITVGANSTVSKSLEKEGLYVNQPMRFIEVDLQKKKRDLTKIQDENLIEDVYVKSKK